MVLTEMVIMPGEDYQAICDSVRAKTGGTELLKSGQVAPAIDGIKVGSNIDTSDATATANDIAYGKTAYVNDKEIVGDIPVESYIDLDAHVWWDKNNNKLNLYSYPSERIIIGSSYSREEEGKTYYYNDLADLYCSGEKLGNATIEDVKQGVTFTSQNGLNLTGTYVPSENSDISALLPFIKTYKTGSFTETSDLAGDEGIYHGWGVKPNFYCIYCEDSESLDSNYIHLAIGIQMTGSGQAFFRYMDQANSIVTAESTFFTSTTFFNLQNSTVKYKANATYNWIIGVI